MNILKKKDIIIKTSFSHNYSLIRMQFKRATANHDDARRGIIADHADTAVHTFLFLLGNFY